MVIRGRQGILLLAVYLTVCSLGTALAQEEAAESAAEEEGSWIDRTLHRYFGGRDQEGEELAGGAQQLVDKYTEHIGKPIEVVIVHQVSTFKQGWDSHQNTSTKLLNRVTGKIHSYTHDSLIRQYLLFEQGDVVDPFTLADSERLLRNLEFINDVRIVLVPLAGEIESVAVVVETRDRWPFGVSGKFKDVDWFEGGLFLSNLGGQGIRFDNKILYRRGFEPELGYRGTLSKQNIRGTFIGMDLEYEDSWRELRRYGEIHRELVHPGIKWVGGVGGEYTDDRDNEDVPRKFRQFDTWTGRTFRVDERPADISAARDVIVPAVRFLVRDWKDRPVVNPDTNLAYHGLRSYMAGLTFRSIKNYKTSFLFRMGEIENIPAGLVLKVTGGYEDGEYHDRTFSFFESAYLSVRNRGDVLMGKLAFGGFFRNQRFEDGLVQMEAIYITPLWGGGRYRHRWYSQLNYTRGINRVNLGGLMLGNRTGLRELDDNLVHGDQRLLAKFESRLFTPLRLWGFHCMVFGFLDAGTVGGEDDPLLQGKVYASGGLGLRLNNPDLVLQTFQFRLALLNTVHDGGVMFAVDFGNPEYPPLTSPSVRPGTFGYQ